MPCNILCLGRCDRICVYTCQTCVCACVCAWCVCLSVSVYACVYMYYTYILQLLNMLLCVWCVFADVLCVFSGSRTCPDCRDPIPEDGCVSFHITINVFIAIQSNSSLSLTWSCTQDEKLKPTNMSALQLWAGDNAEGSERILEDSIK